MVKLFCILNAFNRFEQKRKLLTHYPPGDSQDYQSFDSLLQMRDGNFKSAVNISKEFDWFLKHYTRFLK